jgi:hypothetical protein
MKIMNALRNVTNSSKEVPSNILLGKFNKPSLYIAMLTVGWGIVMTFTGVVQQYAGLLVTRFLLGVFE